VPVYKSLRNELAVETSGGWRILVYKTLLEW
jgi:hypothetical protein